MKKRRLFPFIQQNGMMECGPACLAMIFKYYGYYNIQSLISQLAEVTISGTNLYMLGEVAGQFGFKAEAYEMEYKYLMEIQLPCIAHYSGIHYIVIYKATENVVWIVDPAYGKDKLSKEEFLKKWNGIVLTIEPSEAIFKNKDLEDAVTEYRAKQKSLYRLYYKPVLLSLKKVIINILLASAVLQALGLAIPFFTQTIIDNALVNQNKQLLMVILLGMVAVFATQIILLYARNILLVHARVHFELDFFGRFFKHFISLRQRFYDSNKREDFITRFQENIMMRQLINPSVVECVADLLFVLLYIPVLLIYNVKLGLVAFGFILIYAIITIIYTPKIRALAYKVFYRNMITLGEFLDTLIGMQNVKLLNIQQFKLWQWKNKYRQSLNVVMEAEQQSALLHSVQRGIYYLSQVGIFWTGAYMAFSNEITIGQYIAITAIFIIVLNALNNLSLIWYNLTELSVGLNRLNDIFLQEPENTSILDKVNEFKCFPIYISRLFFKYNKTQEHYILNGLDVHINKGEHIGIAGRNGSGKTTLVKMLVNLYPDYEGNIQFGNTNMQTINPVALRQKVFLFPQDIYVFNGTIKENILYGNLNADMNDVIRAAKLADLHDFIAAQYLGYNFKIGDMGSNLSGGQKLKIGFARLFLSNPELIILDEASSMLDVESEHKIMKNIKAHFKDKTIISIAHRLQTLRIADRIWVIEKGQLDEEGTHDMLMKNEDGLYYRFMKTYVEY